MLDSRIVWNRKHRCSDEDQIECPVRPACVLPEMVEQLLASLLASMRPT
jgi:hypothetical protein